MSIPYYQVDAFTDTLFRGNPAGVCVLTDSSTDWLPDPILQAIAAENNLSETAFMIQRGSYFDLRWFTPTIEVDLCGHATLAAAHVILQHLKYGNKTIEFQTRSGLLTVTFNDENHYYELDFPSRVSFPCQPPESLIEGLGVKPIATEKARDYLALFGSEQDIRALNPNFNALMSLDCLGIIVTAPGEDCDFVSRFFAPRAGILEDPVTGSAHSTLIPYWTKRFGRSTLMAKQVSARGGCLFCHDRGDRVGIGGRAVTYASGLIQIPTTLL
jgi:PhzF family phenazine biosynthesis protein